MKRHRAYALTVAAVGGLVAAVGLLAAGCEMCCNSSRGSGSIMITESTTNESHPAKSEGHKATFSYQVTCVGSYDATEARTVRGTLEYQDHKPWNGKMVRIHGTVGDVANMETLAENSLFSAQLGSYSGDPELICQQNLNLAAFTGTYRPQPVTLGEGGTFTVVVSDNGPPGPSPEDTFTMELSSGEFGGYKVSGYLAKGGIKAF